ncbi:TPA: hypothetical protein U2B98_002138 [Streptococcus suis]|uniref:hypothetical protein n=1 Tax=Streptococcus suis TaxID=1307 RepID=UPI000CF5C18F|nr:hypothetical protein [Streptococcus suis]MDW8759898.1 hypothetical protein [Streptococcus suis]HEM2809627.1 hypothetical protein [Streptococcus suis]HEM5989051.1 hypothetical protein [Streptococcus suis]HEM6089405.1 hypothetical protein [Streptococcus suis]HEM6113151.1 hypothetical protein [Streptococcus suis]
MINLKDDVLHDRMMSIIEVVKQKKSDNDTISDLKKLVGSQEHLMGFSEGQFAEAALDLLGIINYSGDDDKVVELITYRFGGLVT